MKTIYTIKCNECGTVLPENEINMLAEDYGQCNDCFYKKNTQCDFCREFVMNENANEVNVKKDLYDLCNWCFENEDWDSYLSGDILSEGFENDPDYNDYTEFDAEVVYDDDDDDLDNPDYYHYNDDDDDDEEEEIEEEEVEKTLYKPEPDKIEEAINGYIDSDLLDEEEGVR